MSLTRDGRVSVKPFASVPSLPVANLPSIQRAQASVSNLSSPRGVEGGVDLVEGCLVTKIIKYTHQLTHWVNAVRNEDPEPVEDLFEEVLRVTPAVFTLDQPCNLAFLESFVHTALDLYAFIAITASLSTLNDLIEMVQSDNDHRQLVMDDKGIDIRRSLNFDIPSFTNPEYELVALHPEHFLPLGNMLTVYDPGTAIYKHYVVATDRYIRESPHPSSPRLPAFHHVSEDRDPMDRLNVFLVIINAEIKFRRYFAMVQPTTPLPVDVINLMHRTINLVDLLYWQPAPKKGSRVAMVVAKRLAGRRKNPPCASRPDPAKTIESGSSEENMMEDDQEMQIPSDFHTGSSRRSRLRWLADVDLETRIAYGRALMSGHDREYDPALFEDAIPINDPHLYSEKTTIEAWQQGVSFKG
ncbi:hypothetical protein PILCRDRAFT_393899 [Piloderma croceum F 1598]|uniref:Uncharacterized protein n=1 Tax=Piloderma croceum (strain F 1598) TaxID=765440 RepID=A0A0C3C509_PILCF|nr:hypothetical protein PILCRDRAFT_393899 [Piloderma croceum F 1598]